MKLSTNDNHKLVFNGQTKEMLIESLNRISDDMLSRFNVTRQEIKDAISKGIFNAKCIVMSVVMLFSIPTIGANAATSQEDVAPSAYTQSYDEYMDSEFVDKSLFPKPVIKQIELQLDKKINTVTYGDLKEITRIWIDDKYEVENLDFVQYMPNLESLGIQSLKTCNIEALKNTKIKSLLFRYLPISDYDLEYLPASLESLELFHCNYITNLAMLTDFCFNLESLTIDCSPSIRSLHSLYIMRNLKEVSLKEIPVVTEELVNYLNEKGIKHNITSEMLAQAEEIDKIISEIITDDMTDQDKVSAIVSYVMENLDYRLSKLITSNDDPLTSALKGKGVCSSYAYFTSVLLTKAGIESYDVMNEIHAWNIVELDGKYYYVDPTNISQIPLASKLVKHLDAGIYYMQDPFSTFLSAMKDADSKKITISDELLLDIVNAEEEKKFGERYLSNIPVDILAAAGILLALRCGANILPMNKKRRK